MSLFIWIFCLRFFGYFLLIDLTEYTLATQPNTNIKNKKSILILILKNKKDKMKYNITKDIADKNFNPVSCNFITFIFYLHL